MHLVTQRQFYRIDILKRSCPLGLGDAGAVRRDHKICGSGAARGAMPVFDARRRARRVGRISNCAVN